MQTALFLNALPRPTRKAFDLVCTKDWLSFDSSGWYLAGGTALALQLGHRKSVDLDFFTQNKTFDAQKLRGNLVGAGFVVDSFEENTIFGNYNGAKASFIAYPYFVPRVEPLRAGAISILHIDDIALMKIIAISQRGRKRDFVDFYLYLKETGSSLEEVLKKMWIQYPGTAHEINHLLKALTYFEDAEQDPMPNMIAHITWSETKKYMVNAVNKLIKKKFIDF